MITYGDLIEYRNEMESWSKSPDNPNARLESQEIMIDLLRELVPFLQPYAKDIIEDIIDSYCIIHGIEHKRSNT